MAETNAAPASFEEHPAKIFWKCMRVLADYEEIHQGDETTTLPAELLLKIFEHIDSVHDQGKIAQLCAIYNTSARLPCGLPER